MVSDKQNPHLTITGRFHPPVTVPGITGYGTWDLFTWEHNGAVHHGAQLTPEQAPWCALFAALDDVGSSLSSNPVTPQEEANAIVACCWLYGSYAHVLTGGELYPLFRKDPKLSRISDWEMKRINLEFSSGLAAWLSCRETDPRKVHRRVRAALGVVPMPWQGKRKAQPYDFDYGQLEVLLQESLRGNPGLQELSELTVREEANHVVLWAYRNGPVENLHAGSFSFGSVIPGFKRLYADEITRVGANIAKRLRFHLGARERFGTDYLRVGVRAFAFGGLTGWSLTEEISSVKYLGP